MSDINEVNLCLSPVFINIPKSCLLQLCNYLLFCVYRFGVVGYAEVKLPAGTLCFQ